MKDLKDYIALIKFKYHTSFLAIVLIAFFFSGISAPLVQQLLLLYISFNILLYTGLYIINDIADIQHDRQHPLKLHRPIPSGRIPLRTAFIMSLIVIAGGLITGWLFFGSTIVAIYLVFIALNLIYSFVAKHIPYVELLMNTATHPLRAVMAFVLIGQPLHYILIAAYTFFIIGIMTIRRVVEKDVKGWSARKVLHHYSRRVLLGIKLAAFVAMIALAAFDDHSHLPLYGVMSVIYVALVFGMYHQRFIRSSLRSMLTK